MYMFDSLINSSSLTKSLFLLGVGVAGVFFVLILFYILIKVLIKLFPQKGDN